MNRRGLVPLLCVALALALALAAGRQARASSGDNAPEDEMTLQSAGLPADGAGLLAFFRRRSQGEADPGRIADLVEQLGARAPAQRRQAGAELVGLGAPAVPLLRQAVKDPDRPQVAARARVCLKALEDNPAALTAAAVRALARSRPEGTAAALLAFLPVAENEAVVDEVRTALAGVAYKDDKPA